jgi:hypothetical protein
MIGLNAARSKTKEAVAKSKRMLSGRFESSIFDIVDFVKSVRARRIGIRIKEGKNNDETQGN